MVMRASGVFLTLAIAVSADSVLAAVYAKREHVVARLESKSSKETGTYTVLLTSPDGTSCIVAAGTGFFEADRKPVTNDTAS